MKGSLQALAAIFAIVPTVSISADSEFKESVPLEFAQGLLSGPDFGQPTFYSDIADSFPEIDFPQQFELLGSADLVYVTRVILESKLSPAESRQALVDRLTESNLHIVPSSSDVRESVGFSSLDKPVYPVDLCHDNFGNISANFRGSITGSLIVLEHSVAGNSSGSSCTEYVSQRQEELAIVEAHQRFGLKKYQPRMLLPQPSVDQKVSYRSGTRSSGSDDFHEATTVLATDWTLAETYKHIADQINSQGWNVRKENTLGSTTVGEWVNPADEAISLIGTLTVQKTGDSRYKLTFRIDRNLYIPNINNRNNAPFRIPTNN